MFVMRRSGDSAERGFTLVEVLVSTLLGMLVVGGFLSMATFQVERTRDQSNQIELQQTVRDVAELFAREMRRAGADPTCAGDFDALEYASFWGIRMKTDLDGSGAIDGDNEDVLYLYHNYDLIRYAGGRNEILIEGVHWETSRLRYFDADGVEISTGFDALDETERAAVRRVRFEIDVTRVTDNGEVVNARASSDVNLRNRFFVRSTGCA